MVEVQLSKIVITRPTENQVIFLREKDGRRSFPILIGFVEALAIHRRVMEEDTKRPMTHDLLASLVKALDCRLDHVEVTSLHNNTFFAKLVLDKQGTAIEVDSRPSDAIALAVRLEAPIYVAEDVLQEVTRDNPTLDT